MFVKCIGLCDAKAVGGADVKVDHRNVQRGWKWGFGSACMHRMHGTRALTDLAEAGVLIPIGRFVAAMVWDAGIIKLVTFGLTCASIDWHLQSSDST
jgi:hypothetical protein